jgi:hypothetical protein
MADVDDTPAPHVEQTVTFNDATQSVEAEAPTAIDQTYAISGDGEVTLGSFLARPVRIHTFDWTPTAALTKNFNPWEDFLTNPLVIDKWRNFAYLRGNLKLKIVINGSPFYYGRAIVGYLPLDQDNIPWDVLNSHGVSNAQFTDYARVNYLSQCQSAYIDPSTSSSVEMELPFICPRNALRMFKLANSGAADVPVSDLTDLTQMGRIHVHQINPLQQGNTPEAGVDARVTVNVFAWMDNVELSVPTDQRVIANPTAKVSLKHEGKRTKVNMMTGNKEEAEAAQGTVSVSGVASAFEDSLSRLSMVPIIGPFATAGSIASGAMSRIAKVFGYSRPNQLADTMYYQPEPVPKFASTIGAFLGAKLSVDPLNEVTIDPRVGNFDSTDQLTIESFAKQESFLTSFSWSQDGSGSGFNTLFRCAIAPSLYSLAALQSPPGGQTGRLMQPTSVAFAANPFKYWRGTLKVRFQVVASQYHRGRLAVAYEPNIGQQELLNQQGPPDYNGRKIQIFDLQEFDGVEIEFPWAQSEMFCKVPSVEFLENMIDFHPMYTPSINNLYTPVLGAGDGAGYANGFFEVLVVNDLTAAIPDPPPIAINVFVSMPDLEVACPSDNSVGSPAYMSPSRMQADEVVEAIVEEPDAALSLKFEADTVTGKFDHDMGVKAEMLHDKAVDQVFQVCFGERVKSFRSLLKRPQTLFLLNGIGSTFENYYYMNVLPKNTRYYKWSKPSWADLKRDYEVDLFDYIRNAFVGMRGGFRYTFVPYNWNSGLRAMSVDRYQNSEEDPSSYFPGSNSNRSVPVNHLGTHYAIMASNPSLSFESPYYDSSRFVSAQGNKLKSMAIYPHSDEVERVRVAAYVDGTPAFRINVTAAPADDFTFVGRVGAPPVIRLWAT